MQCARSGTRSTHVASSCGGESTLPTVVRGAMLSVLGVAAVVVVPEVSSATEAIALVSKKAA